MAMSAAALVLLLSYIAIFGIQKTPSDEGVAARMFQLLLVGQLPIIGYFGVTWFPKYKAEAIQILVTQLLAALVPFLTVFLLEM